MEGQYCRLEPLDPDRHAVPLFEADQLAPTAADWTYLPYGPFPTLADYLTWMRATSLGSDPLFFAIIELTTNRPVGLAAYLRITPAAGTIEIGHLHYSPLLQRTRAATEAMYLMMRLAFDLGYRRYEWKCDALNAPSRAAAERLGFKYEGTFRQVAVYKGRNRDTAWFSMIDTEWPTIRVAMEKWLSADNFDSTGNQRTRLQDFR